MSLGNDLAAKEQTKRPTRGFFSHSSFLRSCASSMHLPTAHRKVGQCVVSATTRDLEPRCVNDGKRAQQRSDLVWGER